MYQSGEAQTSPTLTSSDSIDRCRPEYLMDEITSNAVTCSWKRKPSASSPAASRAPSKDSRISIGNSWGDNRTLPISSEMELVFVTGPPGPQNRWAPTSIPGPSQWPGAGRFFFQPLRLPPSRPPPRSMPRTAPRQ